MRRVQDVYGSLELLRAKHLPATPVPVRIESVRVLDFDDRSKLLLAFHGKRRQLLLNKTNALRIAVQLGEEFAAWPGKVIYLERTETEFDGQLVDCIRVTEHPPAVPAERFRF